MQLGTKCCTIVIHHLMFSRMSICLLIDCCYRTDFNETWMEDGSRPKIKTPFTLGMDQDKGTDPELFDLKPD